MDTFDVVAGISLIAVAITLVNFVKYVRAGISGQGWNGAVTLVLVFVVLVLALLLYGNSQFGQAQIIGGIKLTSMSFTDILVAALGLTGPAAVFFDFTKAVDNSNSAKTPQLLPPSVVDTAVAGRQNG